MTLVNVFLWRGGYRKVLLLICVKPHCFIYTQKYLFFSLSIQSIVSFRFLFLFLKCWFRWFFTVYILFVLYLFTISFYR
ncbi:hypothetical protein BC829DRAFT_19115 [Chytridium lagenaria]|nr:hypothetical protein BC829DRAFT_19115 [Chytridium lagenaria]